jgi:pyruvate dehydrogenase kinase 2/3/4
VGVQGTLFRASQFLAEELPIRLAHRVQELETLPDGLNDMPSVKKVAEWYAQSFEVWPHIARAPRRFKTHQNPRSGDYHINEAKPRPGCNSEIY